MIKPGPRSISPGLVMWSRARAVSESPKRADPSVTFASILADSSIHLVFCNQFLNWQQKSKAILFSRMWDLICALLYSNFLTVSNADRANPARRPVRCITLLWTATNGPGRCKRAFRTMLNVWRVGDSTSILSKVCTMAYYQMKQSAVG